MRKTLHDFVIEVDEQISSKNWNKFDVAKGLDNIVSYAKLTNRQPKLGDFIPCGEDGNVLEEPSEDGKGFTGLGEWKDAVKQYQQALYRVIFKGDWELIESETHIELLCKNTGFWVKQSRITQGWYCKKGIINRIKDLPIEIEFKEGVI